MGLLTLFKREKNVNEDLLDELAMLKDEVRTLKVRLTKTEALILDVATAQDIIRNKVLRKIQGKKGQEEGEEWAGIPLAE